MAKAKAPRKRLNEWRERNKLSFAELAERLEVSKTRAFRLCHGNGKPPSREEMERIYRRTQYAITPNALFGLGK